MRIPITALIIAAATCVADARLINTRSCQELEKRADIIVVAKPVLTKDSGEETILPHISPGIRVVGISSEFEVRLVLKGESSLKRVVVHHYRLANPDTRMFNAPFLASFNPKESTSYLLFLQREPDGRFAPFDQVDPAWTSLLKLSGTGWDKMESEDFRNWMNARKWLREGPPGPGSTNISPEITPDGRADGSLHEAAMNGKLEKARALIEANPNLVFSQASYASDTPLHLAAEYGHKAVADLLLANKANIEAKAYGGWTPLLRAVFGGHIEMVELLLANKADVYAKDDWGRTPLHVAAENDYTEIASVLLAGKADVNVRNREGDTPLHLAAAHGPKAMVELLVANKAEINAKDNSGRTPLGFAVMHTNKDLVELLRQHGGHE